MIQQAYIKAWRAVAPWQDDAQVEQDLVLSRAVVAIFQQPDLAKQVALRGGTALNKLFIQPPSRYSEDIAPLLNASVTYDPAKAFQRVYDALVTRIPGEPWRGANKPEDAGQRV